MESGVYLLRGQGDLVRMVERPYEAESLLQDQLAAHPDLLAGDQIDPDNPRRWLLLGQEVGVPAEVGGGDWWSIDHLFLDQEAVPTFVEVKRAVDTRARREVVAQMLDYAAHASEYWPADRMRERFGHRCAERGTDPAEELAAFLGPDGDGEAFWALAGANLQEGRVRLLFVADRVPASLRRIVEFLNRQMSPCEVLAVEVRQFAADDGDPTRTLVPRVIGQSEQSRQAKAPPRSGPRSTPMPMAVDAFLEMLPAETCATANAILRVAATHGFVAAGFGRSTEDATVRLSVPGVKLSPVLLDRERLWVSLGRYHPVLRESGVQSEIREAVLRLSPSTRQAADPGKTEVGILLESVPVDADHRLDQLFGALKRALESG